MLVSCFIQGQEGLPWGFVISKGKLYLTKICMYTSDYPNHLDEYPDYPGDYPD